MTSGDIERPALAALPLYANPSEPSPVSASDQAELLLSSPQTRALLGQDDDEALLRAAQRYLALAVRVEDDGRARRRSRT